MCVSYNSFRSQFSPYVQLEVNQQTHGDDGDSGNHYPPERGFRAVSPVEIDARRQNQAHGQQIKRAAGNPQGGLFKCVGIA